MTRPTRLKMNNKIMSLDNPALLKNKIKVVYNPKVDLAHLEMVYTLMAMDYWAGDKVKVAVMLGIPYQILCGHLDKWDIAHTKGAVWVEGLWKHLVEPWPETRPET